MNLRFVFAALLCAFAVWWYLRRTRHDAPPPEATPAAAVDAGALAALDASAAAADPPRFRPISPPARRALLDRMAERRTSRETGRPVPSSTTADAPAPLPGTISPTNIVDAMMPLVPSFQDCYDETRAHRTAPRVEVRFKVVLVGDPELGTLIDSAELDGDEAFLADPGLATCLRETLLAIELPPMTGDSRALFVTSMVMTDGTDPDAGP